MRRRGDRGRARARGVSLAAPRPRPARSDGAGAVRGAARRTGPPARSLVDPFLFPSQAKAVASAAPKIDLAPLAAALPVALAASPANAFQGEIAGIPINVLLSFAPVLLVALPIALVVIGPGALQQLNRVLSGESKNYFGEN